METIIADIKKNFQLYNDAILQLFNREYPAQLVLKRLFFK